MSVLVGYHEPININTVGRNASLGKTHMGPERLLGKAYAIKSTAKDKNCQKSSAIEKIRKQTIQKMKKKERKKMKSHNYVSSQCEKLLQEILKFISIMKFSIYSITLLNTRYFYRFWGASHAKKQNTVGRPWSPTTDNWHVKIICITVIPQLALVSVLPKASKYSHKQASHVKHRMIAKSSSLHYSTCAPS